MRSWRRWARRYSRALGRRKPGELILLAEAATWLGLARLALLTLHFRRIAAALGELGPGGVEAPGGEGRQAAVEEVGWAVATAARHTPWDSKCLAQAIAARMMLKTRRLRGMVYLGLAKDKGGCLTAHAWLKVGDRVLVGARAHETFRPLSSFNG